MKRFRIRKKIKKENNIAFIDAQNLHLWTKNAGWKVDDKKFRIFLKDKFNVNEAYFFLWFLSEDEQRLYSSLQKAWFIVVFREHSSQLKGKKKWNVDVDIVFEIMRRIVEEKDFDKIVLVSWDWDYIKLVNYLIEKKLLKKILFPNNEYSSLYRPIQDHYGMNLSLNDIKLRIEYKKKFKSKKGAS
jgi:uncharacterized LabA/DUF88 family protein